MTAPRNDDRDKLMRRIEQCRRQRKPHWHLRARLRDATTKQLRCEIRKGRRGQ